MAALHVDSRNQLPVESAYRLLQTQFCVPTEGLLPVYLQVRVGAVTTDPGTNANAVVVANVHVNAELQDVALTAARRNSEDCVGRRYKPEFLGLQAIKGESLKSCPDGGALSEYGGTTRRKGA